MAAVSSFDKFARTNQNEAESGSVLEEGVERDILGLAEAIRPLLAAD